MQRPLRRILLPLLLLLAPVPPAQAAVFTRLDAATSRLVANVTAQAARTPRPAAARGIGVPDGVSLMAVDAAGLAAFRAAGGGRLVVPAANGVDLELLLEPYSILTPGEAFSTTDAAGRHPFVPDVTLFRGRVAGEPESWAVVAMGAAGVFGTLEHAGRRWSLAPTQRATADPAGAAPAALPPYALAPEAPRAADAAPFACGINASNEAELSAPIALAEPAAPGVRAPAPAPHAGAQATQLVASRTLWRIAVDCDYEVVHDRFADNLTAAASYVLTVLGTVNLIYERDLEATLTFPYVNLWTTVADPYSATTLGSQLAQMENYWFTNNAGIVRSAAFLMSGRNLGGGISQIGGLCNNSSAYALAAEDFVYTYPTATSTWDVTVTAHELGHVFGSYHTQSCNWAAQGYVPAATTLDSCFVSEGCAIPYTTHLPPDKGTIMSYCHLANGVENGIRLAFHPVCVQRMRLVMAASACSTQAVPAPPRNPQASTIASGVHLAWTAGGSASVLGYEVFCSPTPFDLHPVRVGFTSTLQFNHAGFGTGYYRIRTVRAADTSAWCAEVKGVSPCGMTTGLALAAGLVPVAGATADLNGDSREDAVLVRQGDSSLGTMLGQGAGAVGNGTFSAISSTATGSTPNGIFIADVTGDRIPDLLVVTQGDRLLRLHAGLATAGVPNGTFAAPAGIRILPFAPQGVVAADINEDGIDDLLVPADGTVLRLLGLGTDGVANGQFGPTQSSPVTMLARDLLLHDFNADGVLDMAVTGPGGLRVLPGGGNAGHGDGSFAAPATYAAGTDPGRMAVADFNLDGADDLAVCDRADTVVRVFLGHRTLGVPDGTFAAGGYFGAGPAPSAVCIVDWNHDGVPDLAVANDAAPGTVSVLLGVGDGSFVTRVAVPSGGDGTTALVASDFDENGSVDVLAVNRTGNTTERVIAVCSNGLSTGVTLVSPNGGEAWSEQEERLVSWIKSAGVLSVDLQSSSDAGSTWRTIARELTGTSWKWTVTGPVSSHSRLRVLAHGLPQSNDASNADFSVNPFSGLGVDDGTPRLALLGAWPNPTRRELTVSFALPPSARGTLELVDLQGRRVATRELSGLGPGPHEVALLGRQALPPGIYLVRLRSGAEIRLAKVSVVR